MTGLDLARPLPNLSVEYSFGPRLGRVESYASTPTPLIRLVSVSNPTANARLYSTELNFS